MYPVQKINYPDNIQGKANGQLPEEFVTWFLGLGAHEYAMDAFGRMMKAALDAGHYIWATEGYRLFLTQQTIFFDRYTTQYTVYAYVNGKAVVKTKYYQGKTWYQKPNTAEAAVPGTSNHGWGLSFDLCKIAEGRSVKLETDPEAIAWLVANAHLFGFCWEIQTEVWHIVYFPGIPLPTLNPPETPTPEVPMGLPVGNIDDLSSQPSGIHISGWAYDPDRPDESVQVHIYVGDYPVTLIANMPRPDVNTAFGIGGDHGFEAVVRPVVENRIRVFAIDQNNNAENSLLKEVTLQVPV